MELEKCNDAKQQQIKTFNVSFLSLSDEGAPTTCYQEQQQMDTKQTHPQYVPQ